MSRLLVQRYLRELEALKRVSGAHRESVVREAFKDLLKAWGRTRDLQFIAEHEYTTLTKNRVYIDGALLYDIRVPLGYWEAKDTDDDIEAEIAKKFQKGYPQTNTIFEDSKTAILFQNKQRVMQCSIEDDEKLVKLLDLFFSYERQEIVEFHDAIEQFKKDLPAVLEALRDRIERAYAENADFRTAAQSFLKQAKQTINPAIEEADIREMLIQHILTEDIFARVFGQSDFHRENNVAKALYTLEAKFFKGAIKHDTLRALAPYYSAINATAALISSHSEKQGFLKAIYENFYKVYNPKAADRLGVVYTPSEIVRYMVESTDWLCEQHFGRTLIDKDVEILDPATGTGTFIVELLQHFSGQKDKLRYKYLSELHANEVAILPYYVANLNIEATYAAITGRYEEFPNLCFVDTLDNVAALKLAKGVQGDLFGGISDENVERIKRQNKKKISVVIGNPPYNANQLNENANNKNRDYPDIDARIKSTYVKQSEAQKTKLYDPYVRFFRWASDRIEDNGIVAFITNRSFVEKLSFDGFRKVVAKEFDFLYVLDLGGDIRELSGKDGIFLNEEHTVFGSAAAVGIAISFFVKSRKSKRTTIQYAHPCDIRATRDAKFSYLQNTPLQSVQFKEIKPDRRGNWVGLAENDFESFLPLISKATKATKTASQERAIFKLFSLGVSTNRDEWLYDFSKDALAAKVKRLISSYDSVAANATEYPDSIKWSRNLKRKLAANTREKFAASKLVQASYRPFCRRWLYQSTLFTDELGQADELFPAATENRGISFSAPGFRKEYCVLAIDGLADLHFGAAADGYQQVTRFRFKDKTKLDNVTDWALKQFNDHYKLERQITKDDIFAYVYAVLHDPIYRKKYAANLKREFPRIPFYDNFVRWRDWGNELLTLHLSYEKCLPYQLHRVDKPDLRARAANVSPAVKLKADKKKGTIQLDSETQLTGVPADAWSYQLGNRCALDWVLNQCKPRTPSDPVIREHFNTYRFASHREHVVDLLSRVTTVSVRTVEIAAEMTEGRA